MRSTHRAGSRSSYRHSLGHRPVRNRSAFTLLEVMIATAVTLLMMISLVQVFKVIGDSMKQGRAALQMNNSLRSVTTRLRQDLGNLTVRVDPPSDASSGGGYFEYFDGSMTDYTAALFAGDAPKSNRFGDTDDILMFTARAGSSWFTGQVPTSIVTNNANDSGQVVITSQLAEIAVFARPVQTAAAGGGFFDDVDVNQFPDSFRLHYRVLLIRPDLNNPTTGALTFPNTPAGRTPVAADSPNAMALYFADCDLSMHRDYNGGSTPDQIVANSLEDLANPANRFAHFQYSLPNMGVDTSCTMPLLVLDDEIILPALNARGLYQDPPPNTLPGATGNFLSSKYVLGFDERAISINRIGEDVIANNILAFDVKGYDPGVPIIATQGADGAWGVGNAGTAGQDGSDDIILTPNDPGYALAFTGTNMTVSYGEYVDLLWGKKALNALPSYPFTSSTTNFSTALSGLQGALLPPLAPLVKPNLGQYYSDGLKRSGKAIIRLPNYAVVQPTYDTWTTAFESNGTAQMQLGIVNGNNSNDFGTIDVNARSRKYGVGSIPTPLVDTGTDGLDNAINGVTSGGVDDSSERETLPPFPIKLRGIKVSVRMEDLNTRQIKQMSVASEFATQ